MVTVPQGDNTKAFLCFLDDKDGQIDNVIPIPTWDPVSYYYFFYLFYLIFIMIVKLTCELTLCVLIFLNDFRITI